MGCRAGPCLHIYGTIIGVGFGCSTLASIMLVGGSAGCGWHLCCMLVSPTDSWGYCRKMLQAAGMTYNIRVSLIGAEINELLIIWPKSTMMPPESLTFGGQPTFVFGGGGTSFSGLRGTFLGRPTWCLMWSMTSFNLGHPCFCFMCKIGWCEECQAMGEPQLSPASSWLLDKFLSKRISGSHWLREGMGCAISSCV